MATLSEKRLFLCSCVHMLSIMMSTCVQVMGSFLMRMRVFSPLIWIVFMMFIGKVKLLSEMSAEHMQGEEEVDISFISPQITFIITSSL